jgi:hypothetical protein
VEVILIEVLLWAGLIFFFWALRDGLNRIESELEAQPAGAGSAPRRSHAQFDQADKVSEPIGRYRDTLIYRFAVIDGRHYQFAHVLPWESLAPLHAGERCLAPGVVYACCEDSA